MDAYLKNEQIGTLFVLVGAPEGGFRGGGGQGDTPKSKRAFTPKSIGAFQKKQPPDGWLKFWVYFPPLAPLPAYLLPLPPTCPKCTTEGSFFLFISPPSPLYLKTLVCLARCGYRLFPSLRSDTPEAYVDIHSIVTFHYLTLHIYFPCPPPAHLEPCSRLGAASRPSSDTLILYPWQSRSCSPPAAHTATLCVCHPRSVQKVEGLCDLALAGHTECSAPNN